MDNNKSWYEKISIWITIIAGVCTILGLSVFGIMKGTTENETNTVQNIVGENEDESGNISEDKNDDSDNNESFSDEDNNEYQRLKDKYDQLLIEMENLTAENTNLKDENYRIQKDLEELQNENTNIQKDLDLVKEENNQLKEENDRLKEENNQLITENAQLKVEVEDLKKKIKELIGGDDLHNDNDLQNDDDHVSIFTLETFSGKGGWSDGTYSSSSFTDTYGNLYSSAYEAYHIWEGSSTPYKPPVYLLDKQYSKCIGQLAWPKDQKDLEGYIWIEFYSDDELLYKTDRISADDRVLSFEFSVEDVEKLKIYRKGTRPAVRAIYPYLDLIK